MMNSSPLKALAKRVAELAAHPENQVVRTLWMDHNRLKKVRPPIYVRIHCWHERISETEMVHKEGILREVEFYFRTVLYNATLGFDLVVDPLVIVPAVYSGPSPEYLWGPPNQHRHAEEQSGAWGFNPSLHDYTDIEQLRKPLYQIDHLKTNERVALVRETIGDVLQVHVDYSGPIGITASIGQAATNLCGFQQLMTDVIDHPQGVHRLMSFLMQGHLDYMKEMQRQNLVTANHVRWPFYHEPFCPDYDPQRVRLKDCWGYGESQEFDLFSPAMLDEFLLTYQIPIFALTGLNHYGCCENLTCKYPLLKKIPGLRRVSVSPWTDFEKAVEIMGGNYVLNWRYPPAEVIFNFDEDKIKNTLARNLEIAQCAPVEIILQDIETLNGHPERIRRWVQIARAVADA